MPGISASSTSYGGTRGGVQRARSPRSAVIGTSPVYYISSSGGSNSNTGLSAASPWLDWTNLHQKSFPPGSVILLKSGDTFNFTGYIGLGAATGGQIYIQHTGDRFHPLTFSTYGGTAPAILNFTGNIDGFYLANVSGVVINNLNIVGDATLRVAVFSLPQSGAVLKSGIHIEHAGGGATYSGITITNCKIQGFYNGGLIGINTGLNYDLGLLSGITISGNEFTDTTWRGIDGFLYRGNTRPFVNNITISGNNFHDIQGTTNPAVITAFDVTGTPILANSWNRALIINNTINHAMYQGGGNYGIGAYFLTNSLIQSNKISLIGAGVPGDSGGIEINAGSDNVIVQFNFVHDCDGLGIRITNDSGNQTNNIVVRYNIFAHNLTGTTVNSGTKHIVLDLQNVNPGTSLNNILFYNNTIIDNPDTNALRSLGFFEFGTEVGGSGDPGRINNVTIANNVLYSSATTNPVYGTVDDTPLNRTGFMFQSNDWMLPSGGSYTWLWNNSTFTTLATFGQDATGIIGNASLLNPTGYGTDASFQLNANSPCIGAGTNLYTLLGPNWWDPFNFGNLQGPTGTAIKSALGKPRDYFGGRVLPPLASRGWDIGAIQFGSTPPNPPPPPPTTFLPNIPMNGAASDRVWFTPARLTAAQNFLLANGWTRNGSGQWAYSGSGWTYTDQMSAAWLVRVTNNNPAPSDPTTIPNALNFALNNVDGDLQFCGLMNYILTPQDFGQGPDNYRRPCWRPIQAAFLWQYMGSANQQTLINRFNGYIETFKTHTWGGAGMQPNNYFAAFRAWELCWAIASYWDNLPYAEQLGQWFFNGSAVGSGDQWESNGPWQQLLSIYGAGGTCENGALIEGGEYSPYVAGYMLTALDAANICGRDLWTECPAWRNFVFTLAHWGTELPLNNGDFGGGFGQGLYSFSDVEHNGGDPGIDWWFADLANYAASRSTAQLGQLAQRMVNVWQAVPPGGSPTLMKNTGLWHMQRLAPNGTALSNLSQIGTDLYQPGIGFGFARSGWGNNESIGMMFHGGAAFYSPPVGHCHCEPGAVETMMRITIASPPTDIFERGARSMSNYNHSYPSGPDSHSKVKNVPLIWFDGANGGLGDWQGTPQVNPLVPSPSGQASLLRLQSATNWYWQATDFTQCYRSWDANTDNPHIVKVVREVLLFRPGNIVPVVFVLDRLQTDDAARPRAVAWHGYADLIAQADGKRFLSGGATNPSMYSTVEFGIWTPFTVAASTHEVADNSDPNFSGYTRFFQDNQSGTVRTMLSTVRQYYSKTLESMSVADNGTTLTITIGTPALHTLSVQRTSDASPSGWTIDTGGTAPTNSVCRVDDSGIHWS